MMEVIAILFVFVFYFAIIGIAVAISILSQLLFAATIGAIPLMCGLVKKKKGLAWIGFGVAIALYWLIGFLPAQIASAVFTYLIIKDEKKEIAESEEKEIAE